MGENLSCLYNIARIGIINSVDRENKTVRVLFNDKYKFVSGPLKVLNSTPKITIQKTMLTYGNSGSGEHTHDIVIDPWFPEVEESVLCIFPANGNGDGFVIGGI